MNTFTLPPCPNWAGSNIATCTQDNILIYAARNTSIIVLRPSDDSNKAATVDCITVAHKDRIIAVAVDHNNWLKPQKYFATAALDNIVKLWDFNTLMLKQCHNAHKEYSGSDKCVAVNFVNNNVISATTEGHIAVWDIIKNTVRVLNKIKQIRITCMVTSLHKPDFTIIGTANGFVFAMNTKEKGEIVYKIRCFHNEITSLSFCPSPYNVFEMLRVSRSKTNQKNDNKLNAEIDKLCERLEKCRNDYKNIKSQEKKPEQTSDSKLIDDETNQAVVQSDVKINVYECTESQDDDVKESSGKEGSDGSNTPSSGVLDDTKSDIVTNEESIENVDVKQKEEKKETPTKDHQQIPQEFEDGLLRKSVENHDSIGREEHFEYITKASNLENYLFLTKMKQSANVSIASSLNVEIDSMENETIDSVSEISERENESKTDETKSEIENSNRECSSSAVDSETNIMKDEESRNLSSDSINTETEPNKDLLLAVSGKNDGVSIWRIGGDGRLQTKFKLPRKKKFDNKNRNQDTKIIISWTTPNTILLSYHGELLACDITKGILGKLESSSFRLIHSDHKNKGIHSIITPPYSDDRGKDLYAWTVGYDRTILRTKLSSDRTCLNHYPTFNGYIYDIVSSPLDPSRVAIAGGDSSLKLFDLSRPHTNVFNIRNVSIRGCDKVLAIAWHPTKENCLALCYTAGQIGILDPNNPSKPVQYLRQYLRGNIYSLTWGPPVTNIDCKFVLYACSDGICVAYNVKNRNEEPTIIKFKDSDSLKLCDMSWKPDYSLFTFGCSDGIVIFLNRNLDVLCTTYDFNKSIHDIAWHPQMTASDNEESLFSKYLAVASINGHILVYNTEKVSEGERPEIVANLQEHTSGVNTVCWSPHTNGLLMSGSSDGTVRIWNVIDKTLIALYDYGNQIKIFSCLWSPLDADIVFSGGTDNIVRAWKISEHPPTLNKLKPQKPNVLNAKIEKFDENDDKNDGKISTVVNVENETEAIATLSNEKKKKREFLTNPFKQGGGINSEMMFINSLKKLIEQFSDSKCDLEFEFDSNDDKSNDINEFQSDFDPNKLFYSQSDVLEYLDDEEKIQKEMNLERYEHLQVWRSKIKELVQAAINTRTLDYRHISLAPVISHSFWRDTCLAFANQLKENGLYFRALDYYLITNNMESGINMLVEAKCFREALALTKARLSEDDPLIVEILNKWIEYSNKNGRYEVAAQCYITQKKFNEAAKLLAKKVRNRNFLKIALKLANLANNSDLSKSIQINLDNLENITAPEMERLVPLKNITDLVLETNNKTTDLEQENSLVKLNTEIEQNINDGVTDEATLNVNVDKTTDLEEENSVVKLNTEIEENINDGVTDEATLNVNVDH